MRDHKKLKAFELADTLVIQIYKITSHFPKEELFSLTSQLRRAATSIASNIVEGCARHSQADYLHFLDMAYGSACEVEYQLSIAYRLDYIQKPTYQTLHKQSIEVSKVINGLIRSLRTPQA
jgi:four helix bundle protein